MQEVKKPKKPLIYYYVIFIAIGQYMSRKLMKKAGGRIL